MVDITEGHKKVVIFWQEPRGADEYIGEPAIKLLLYSDVVELQQAQSTILITKSCVPEFIKALKAIIQERKP